MSKTERALTSTDGVDALDDEFDDGDVDEMLDDVAQERDHVDRDDPQAEAADDDDTMEHDIVEGEHSDDEDLDDELSLPDVVAVIPAYEHLDSTTGGMRRPAAATIESDRYDDDTDDDAVSDDILEALRRADIDGPAVAFAPQDEPAAQRRKPKRAADYDPAPVPIPVKVPRVLGRRPRVRKVTRVVRHVDPWSVFKVALVAHLLLYVIVLTASVLLWNVAYATGTVENIERFFESFGWDTFNFNGGELYHAGWIAGLFLVIGFTGLAVLASTMFNLITDLVGGVRFTVLEEEVIEARTSPMRRFVVRRTEPIIPPVVRDEIGTLTREAMVDDSGAITRPTR